MGEAPAALLGQPAEVRLVVEVTRAETGVTETFELVGRIAGEEADGESD